MDLTFPDGVVHPLALVEKDCTLGRGTMVWQFATVIRQADIGSECSVGAGAVVDGAKLGDGCSIGAGAQLHPGTRIGNGVFVGPGAIFCNDRWPRTSKVGFDVQALKDRATVIVGDGASIGAGAIILPGVRIGAGAMIAAGVVCENSVPANHLLRRDGSIELMPEDGGRSRRMRYA